ncbi:MAG: hypothetical protein KatS3mg124_0712 [Porticoccaceae bacterium]|nr:MAG: hypothetical protein KatS3mg124_0712 [Porticoccaceae bacterium]
MSALLAVLAPDAEPLRRAWAESAAAAFVGGRGAFRWWHGAGVSLAARRRPTARGEPLAVDRETGAAVVADARLDERSALAGRLGLPATAGEAELILAAWRRWGLECPAHLAGDFAFIVWDPVRRILYCVRDRLGARSLAVARGPRGRFACASEIRALLALPWVDSRLDPEVMATLFVPEYPFGDWRRTWFRGVEAVEAGTSLAVGPEKPPVRRRWWALAAEPPPVAVRLEETLEEFRARLSTAVARRLPEGERPALLLSGGLDSAGILGAMAELRQGGDLGEVDAYSVVADDAEQCVESRCIAVLAERTWVRPRRLAVPSFTGLVELDAVRRIAWTRPHPIKADILLPAALMAAAAAEGHRVLLYGAAGDLALWTELWYLVEPLRAGRLLWALAEARRAARHHTYLWGRSAAAILFHNLVRAGLPARLRGALAARAAARRARRALAILDPELVARASLQERWRASVRAQPYLGHRADYARVVAEMASGLSGFGMTAAEFDLEVRDPYADVELVQFLARVPLAHKVREGFTKYPLRAAYEREITAPVAWRTGKEHLGFHFHEAVLRADRARIRALLEGELSRLEGVLDLGRVRDRLAPWLAGGGDFETRAFVWDLVSVLAWLVDLEGRRP